MALLQLLLSHVQYANCMQGAARVPLGGSRAGGVHPSGGGAILLFTLAPAPQKVNFFSTQCFLQSRQNARLFLQLSELGPPPSPPHPQAIVSPPFGSGGKHSLAGEGVGGPNFDEGTELWYSRYRIFVLCVVSVRTQWHCNFRNEILFLITNSKRDGIPWIRIRIRIGSALRYNALMKSIRVRYTVF